MRFLRFLTVDPVNLSPKAKAYSFIACFCSVFFVALITHIVTFGPQFPLIVASMGASAVILFFIPNSPLAQPWPFAAGQISSALVGTMCALHINETASASAAAVGGAVFVMLLLRCLHPPAAATSLAPVTAGDSITSLGYEFVLQPVAINVAFMLLLAVFINRWILKLNYPNPLTIKESPKQPSHTVSEPSHRIGISEQDLELALKDLDFFVDMTHSNLSKILTHAEMNTFKRIRGDITCADIMLSNITSVEFGTDIEDAWQIIYQQQLKAIPVTDKANHVIGIITEHDFFKYINLNIHENILDKFQSFIRRTTGLTSNKPESVGQIMASPVMVMPDTTHIADLIPLMSIQGHRQIPIVNTENHLVGMVYQANLIAALYNNSLATK